MTNCNMLSHHGTEWKARAEDAADVHGYTGNTMSKQSGNEFV